MRLIPAHVHVLLLQLYLLTFFFSGPPSPPRNLSFTWTSTTTDNVAARLDWDPPLNDGGNYLIFVNGSEMNSSSTSVTLTLNSTGQYLIEISAVNDCGLNGDSVSVIISGDTGWYALHHVNYYMHCTLYKCNTQWVYNYCTYSNITLPRHCFCCSL